MARRSHWLYEWFFIAALGSNWLQSHAGRWGDARLQGKSISWDKVPPATTHIPRSFHHLSPTAATLKPRSLLIRDARHSASNYRRASNHRLAFHLWGKHHEHEGRALERSTVWQRFSNTTGDATNSSSTTIQQLGSFSTRKNPVFGILSQEDLALDKVEQCVCRCWGQCKPFVSTAAKALAGGTMCLFGAHYARCAVVFHTMRVTGWPAFHKAVQELFRSYSAAREVVKSEVSKVVRPGELFRAVSYELKSVHFLIKESQKKLEDGYLSRMEAMEIIRRAQIDKKRLEYEAWCLNQALDSVAALGAAIDLTRLREAGKGLYTGALACFASSSSMTVCKLSLAFDLGGILANNLSCVCATLMSRWHSKELARILPPETRRFIKLSFQIMGAIQGLLIVNTVLPKVSLRISSAALGAAWLTDAITEICDPWIQAHDGWNPMANHLPYAVLQVGLTIGGYYVQKTVYPGKIPLIVERVLSPLAFFEKRLNYLNSMFAK